MEGYKRPAQGLTPERIWKMNRLDEIKLAISRRAEHGDPVDPAWINEYNKLREEIYESRVNEKHMKNVVEEYQKEVSSLKGKLFDIEASLSIHDITAIKIFIKNILDRPL